MASRATPNLRFRAVYEDFQPKSETTDTPEALILQIHLPGFVTQQVRIRYASTTNMISISGERPISGISKWSRFRQAYPVPEICEVKKFMAKFDQGILTITMPKKIIPQVAAPQEDEKTTQEKAPSPSEEAVAEPKPEKAQMETPPTSTPTPTEEPRDQKRVSPADLKAPTPSEEAVAEPKTEKARVETSPKSTSASLEEPREKRSVSLADLKTGIPSKETVAEPKTEKAELATPPTSTVEEPRDKRRVSFADMKAQSPSKEAVTEPKTEKAQVIIPPKLAYPGMEAPREKTSVSFADQKAPSDQEDTTIAQKPLPDITKPAHDRGLRSLIPPEPIKVPTKPQVFQRDILQKPTETTAYPKMPHHQKGEEFEPKPTLPLADLKARSPSKETVAEPKTEKAELETPPTSTVEERRVSFVDLKAPSPSKEAVTEPKTEKAQVIIPPKLAYPGMEEPREKTSVSFADQKAPSDQEDTTIAQKPLPDIKKPADERGVRSSIPPEPIKVLTKPQVVQREILQKPTETTAYPKMQLDGVVQKGEEFEPKPTLPSATRKQTDENTQKGPEEFLPKTSSTTAPLDPKTQIYDKLQKVQEDFMQKPELRTFLKMQTDENTVGRKAKDAEDKEVKEPIAKPFEPGMPQKGMEKDMVKATESKERKVLGMGKEKEATSIYKEKQTKNIIDTLGRGIKEVAASTSYAVTNIADNKLKDEEKNLLSMVIGALAAHVSYRVTSSRKPQN